MKTINLLSIVFLLCGCIPVAAQETKTFRYEFTGVTDNDDYNFKYTDRYYSNGLFLKFSAAQKDIDEKKPGSVKKIVSVELGQQMFNPHSHDMNFLNDLDRPFAGVLYIKPSVTRISAKENVWQYGLQGGVMGPSAYGRQVQTWWHGAFNILRVYGWETQLNDEAFINFNASYHHHLLNKQKDNPWYDVHAFSAASLGNNLTNAAVGLQFKFGRFEKAFQSVAWNSRIQKTKQAPAYRSNHEVYFYFEPQLTFQAYNAVLQGGMFRKDADKGYFFTSVKPIVYQHRYGILYAQHRWSLQLGYTFRTREAKGQKAIENFGTMRVSYRFR